MALSLKFKQGVFATLLAIYLFLFGVWIAGGTLVIRFNLYPDLTWHNYAQITGLFVSGIILFALWAYYGFYRPQCARQKFYEAIRVDESHHQPIPNHQLTSQISEETFHG